MGPRPETTRVALIDDHAVVREGLRAVLREVGGFEVVGEASDATHAVDLVRREAPDVAITDVVLEGSSGILAAVELMRAAPRSRTLMYSMYAETGHIVQALAAGVRGYALKSQPMIEIVDAVRTVAAGGFYLAPAIPRSVLDEREQRPLLSALSRREREVFELAARGASNDAVARELGISIKTVETHRARINKKLDVHSPAELVRFAARHGLVTA